MTLPARARSTGVQPNGRRELILAMLQAARTPLTIRDIARELGVHPNTVRFHLDALADAGRVERLSGEVGAPGRPGARYRAARVMDRNGPFNYYLLAAILTSHLSTSRRNPAATAVELGRAWGPNVLDAPSSSVRRTRADALGSLNGVLATLGFEPEPIDGRQAQQIRLHHCPFLSLAEASPAVVCSIHLGLMQGALDALGGPVTVDRLDRFAEPDLCVAHLARRVPESDQRT